MSATGLTTNIRRLPGLRFEAQSPPLADSLPRMDVAVFVGFAASGPINQPVVIEDGAQFAAIFGEDLPLGWDADRGATVRAYLGPAVRDFFRQGGTRCWIIRVARDAKYNYFPIPALLERRANGELYPAFASARAEGSWSDTLRVGTSLQSHPIEVTIASFAEHKFELSPNSPGDVRPGDLLRFNLRAEGYGLFGVVESVQAVEPVVDPPSSEGTSAAKQRRVARRRSVRVQCAQPLWFKSDWLDDIAEGDGDVARAKPVWFKTSLLGHLLQTRVSPVVTFNEDGSPGQPLDALHWSLSDEGQSITFRFISPALLPSGAKLLVNYFHLQLLVTVQAVVDGEPFGTSPPRETVQVSGRVDRWLPLPLRAVVPNHKGLGPTIQVTEGPFVEGHTIKLNCSLPLADAPAPGAVMRVDFEVGQLWLMVREKISITDASVLSPTGSVQIEGSGFWPLVAPPNLPPETLVEAERLTFDLFAREAGNKPLRLGDLGFDEKHSRYWGVWPTDEQRYQGMRTLAFAAGASANQASGRECFPLAGGHSSGSSVLNGGISDRESSPELYLPLAMPFTADFFLGAVEQSQPALERDGLTTFGSDLFLDAQLIDPNVENLLAQADYLRYQSPRPRSLKGIHAALDIEEATIISVPDAVHRGWTYKPLDPVRPAPSERLTHAEWWRFLDCKPQPNQLPLADQPAWENFLDCDLPVLRPPPQITSEPGTPTGMIALVWSTIPGATRYVVEESGDPAWTGAEVIYSGSETRLVIYGRSEGDYYYRVRAEKDLGDCVGKQIVDWMVQEFKRDQGPDLSLNWRALRRLTKSAAQARIELSSALETEINLPFITAEAGSPKHLLLKLTRVKFEQLTHGLVAARATSEWSDGMNVRTRSATQWQVGKKEEYSAASLLEVHRGLLRLCAARADLFAVLALPSHYREDDAITHAEILRPAKGSLPLPSVQNQTGNPRVAPLSAGEERATSYGAIYHPWLITRRDNFLEPWELVPPDGAACGVMAQRAVTRGAWSAPANELLRGVVALAPPLAAGRRSALQDAQVNIFRHEPRGFLSLSADTLSRDMELRPINVRRLLILLRRLALRLGETYVFEPNDDSFRRLVQRGFEAALDRMFARGAFAGRTAATSYQVVTDTSLNTPNSMDQGRFIVELRVAPSLPLTFITVRLIQTNDRSSVMEVR